MLQRPRLSGDNLAVGTIPALQQCGRSSAMGSLACVMNPAFAFFTGHSCAKVRQVKPRPRDGDSHRVPRVQAEEPYTGLFTMGSVRDRKSTRLNSSHSQISYAVFCLKK